MTVHAGISGSSGRMGRMLVQMISERDDIAVTSASEHPSSDAVGRDVGEVAGTGTLGVTVVDSAEALFSSCDVVIDFSSPAATIANARVAAATGKGLVAGTTGLDASARAQIAEASRTAAIVSAGNMSLGVNLLLGITRKVAAALDEEFDIEVVETHHRHKVDAPSGTALMLAEAAAKGRGVILDEVADRGRDGITGARRRGAIGMAAMRGGDVVGEHQVMFLAPGERIEIGHRASDRVIFVRGAITAARWLHKRPAGLYGMEDVLGLAGD